VNFPKSSHPCHQSGTLSLEVMKTDRRSGSDSSSREQTRTPLVPLNQVLASFNLSPTLRTDNPPSTASDIINAPNTSLYHASSPSTVLFSFSRTGRGPHKGQMDIDDADVGDFGDNNARDISSVTPLSITDSGGAAFSKPLTEKEEASSQSGSESRTVENLLLSPKFSDGQRRTVGPILSSSASPLKLSKRFVWSSVRCKSGEQPRKDEEVARRCMNEDINHQVELALRPRNQNPTDLPSAYTDQKVELMKTDLLEEKGVQSVSGGKGRLFSMDTSEVRPNDIALKVGEVEFDNSPGTTMEIEKTMGRSEVGVQVEVIDGLKDRKNKATQVELGTEDDYSTTLQPMRQDDVVEAQKMRSNLSALVDNLVSAKMQSLTQTIDTVKRPPLQEEAQSISSRASADTNSMIKGLFDELAVLHEEAQSRERRVKEEIEAIRQLHSVEVDALRRRLSYLESHCATHRNRGRVYEIEKDETLNQYDADELSIGFASQSDYRCMVDKRFSYHAPTDDCHAKGLLKHSRNEDNLLPIKTQRKQHIIASSRAPVC